LIYETVRQRPEIVSTARYDHRGQLLYAWPSQESRRVARFQAVLSQQTQIQQLISSLGLGLVAEFAFPDQIQALRASLTLPELTLDPLPPDLLARTREGGIVSESEFSTTLCPHPHHDTYLLVTPVHSILGDTGYLVYEINPNQLFQRAFENVIDDIDDSESGQLWVFDSAENEIYETGHSSGNLEEVRQSFDLDGITQSGNQSYEADNTEYETAVVPINAVDNAFTLLVSHDVGEATDAAQGDLLLIFGLAIGAGAFVLTSGGYATNRLMKEATQRRQAEGLRRTSRALLEVSRALNASLDIETVLNRILLELQSLIPFYSASILLHTPEGLEVAAHRGEDEASHQKGVFSIEEARAARQVISGGEPVIINDTSLDERWTPVLGSNIRSWIGLPLRVFDRNVGVLNVNSDQVNYFTREDIELAETLADQASVALQNARRHEQEVKRVEQELIVARGIQNSLQPVTPPEVSNLEIAFRNIASRTVSGDFFQLIPMTNNQLGIVIGDVTGKGMPAALIMAVITTALRDEINRHRDPGELLNILNERLIDRLLQSQMNSALITAIYDPKTRDLAIANAGMVQPYVWQPETGEWDWIDIGGYPLGASQNSNYKSKVINLPPNALLVMFSDGIIEAQNADREFFGFDRLEDLLENIPHSYTADQIRQYILDAVEAHLGDEVNQDDVTIMVLRGLEVEETPEIIEGTATPNPQETASAIIDKAWDGETTYSDPVSMETAAEEVPAHTYHVTANIRDNGTLVTTSNEGYAMPRENVELFLPSTLGYEKVARNAAAAIAREMGFSEDRIEDLMTAVAEACMNAIEHGNLQDNSTSVTVLMSSTSGRLDVRVSDHGRRSIPDPLPPPGNAEQSRGWGIFFIQSLMDEVEISQLPEGGNMVKMTIYLGHDEDEELAELEEYSEPSSDASEWIDQES
jgi:serine phosphatase RsbU (regulator of sigma subunit)/anti-sigma regulatory factor (Ser/Thr protein kinase)